MSNEVHRTNEDVPPGAVWNLVQTISWMSWGDSSKINRTTLVDQSGDNDNAVQRTLEQKNLDCLRAKLRLGELSAETRCQ